MRGPSGEVGRVLAAPNSKCSSPHVLLHPARVIYVRKIETFDGYSLTELPCIYTLYLLPNTRSTLGMRR